MPLESFAYRKKLIGEGKEAKYAETRFGGTKSRTRLSDEQGPVVPLQSIPSAFSAEGEVRRQSKSKRKGRQPLGGVYNKREIERRLVLWRMVVVYRWRIVTGKKGVRSQRVVGDEKFIENAREKKGR